MDQAAILDHEFVVAAYTVTWVIQLAIWPGWVSSGARKSDNARAQDASCALDARIERRTPMNTGTLEIPCEML